MKDEVLDRLKLKEEEMEAFIEQARKEANAIKEAALRKAKEIKDDTIKKLEVEIRKATEEEERLIAEEVGRIDSEGEAGARSLREKGLANMDKAVTEVVRTVLGGIGDQGDEKGPDNRT